MPENIRNQLLEGIRKKALNKAVNIDNDDENDIQYYDNTSYFINDDELIKLLNGLDKDFNDDYKEWINISSIVKKADFKGAWKTWSSQSKKNNEKNNEKIFKRLKTKDNVPDLNYVIEILNTQ